MWFPFYLEICIKVAMLFREDIKTEGKKNKKKNIAQSTLA